MCYREIRQEIWHFRYTGKDRAEFHEISKEILPYGYPILPCSYLNRQITRQIPL